MKTRIGRRLILLGVLLTLWLATSACSCSGLIGNARPKPSSESSTPVIIISPVPTETAMPPTATRRAPTPTTSKPTSSPTNAKSTEALKASATSAPVGLAAIPDQPNVAFVIELTQEQVNEYLAGKTYEAQGVTVKEIQVVLTAQELLCTFRATQEKTKLSAGVSVRGVPSVADGKAYFKVNDIVLDDSIKGFARLLAKAAIDEAVKQYSTPQGILVPVENVEFESIELMPGKIVIAGRTR